MKVLFAVSNDKMTEAIVNQYQKDFKEIIVYKSVYYFNAILKELQRDKSYDRVVISEDLEQAVNSDYQQKDNFIFGRLDSISDEASNLKGEDIPIILICEERRQKGEELFSKLFGIGIYNAIIGNDRSINEVCRLINRPRVKKDAKIYYKIDSGEVAYEKDDENEVSEMEIQNILAHYKRIGNDENKMVESFNSIANQYNEYQLKAICQFLPLNVKAVLEEKSPRYAELNAFNLSVSDDMRVSAKESKNNKKQQKNEQQAGTSEIMLGKANTMREPVVIPSAMSSNQKKKIVTPNVIKPIQRPQEEHIEKNEDIEEIEDVDDEINDMFRTNDDEPDEIDDELQFTQDVETVEEPVAEPVKRGRGRPKKAVTEPVKQAPKRGRGRPKKVDNQEELLTENDETDFDDELDFNSEPEPANNPKPKTNDYVLPGFGDDDEEDDDEDLLPGFSSNKEKEDDSDKLLTDFLDEDDEDEEDDGDDVLPGFSSEEKEDDEDLLPGISSQEAEEDDDEDLLPGLSSEQTEEENDDDLLPGLSSQEAEEDDEEDILPGFQSNEEKRNMPSRFSQNEERRDVSPRFTPNRPNNEIPEQNNYADSRSNENMYSELDLNSIMSSNQKLVSFVGTSKNGTSFLVNNVAEVLSMNGINTAILDLTQNRNAYYIYTKNEENLRVKANGCFENLKNGVANGIEVHKGLTVYTSAFDIEEMENVEPIIQTLLKNHTIILMDCDFSTPERYFKYAQEIYLVQSMDILTIQPFTAFLRNLSDKGIFTEQKARVIINKYIKTKELNEEILVGGISIYNDAGMTVRKELFNRRTVKRITIPFEVKSYLRYLDGLVICDVSLKGYSKELLQSLKKLATMVYENNGSQKNGAKYNPPSIKNNGYNQTNY